MTTVTFSTPDAEMVADFFNDFEEAYQASEHLLLQLEKDPKNGALLNDLFRRVHTIKGNLIYVGLADICPILQSVEDVLEPLRRGRLRYDDLLSDVILLAMDTTHELVENRLQQEPNPFSAEHMQFICEKISLIANCESSQRASIIGQAIKALDPAAELAAPDSEFSKHGVAMNNDLRFFAQLLPAIDQRSPYWAGRTQRIAELALSMNSAASAPIDPNQLLAAVYMHDFAMAFLPLELLHKPEKYTSQERLRVQAHVQTSGALMREMGNWADAAEIILQHHEQCNGAGYPNNLAEQDICEGAKVLAIADAFDACVNSRAHVDQPQRPLIRAILEINRYAGSQFSQAWVNIFNQIARPKRNQSR
ncbi:hypothetical protein R50072_23610 [Simiduia litorea]|uniref:HD-GYP domain-containing protein n=1 Tax=Simiduia litorea TaxID=1435348 RepID=UPI0036F3D2DF